ncbi:hypothetical protein DBR06_SOUSAS6410068 [Sousa chinensis]|nr:hypothetical protein DBR06_SOUSAS6410068 [Sousa chinensis]
MITDSSEDFDIYSYVMVKLDSGTLSPLNADNHQAKTTTYCVTGKHTLWIETAMLKCDRGWQALLLLAERAAEGQVLRTTWLQLDCLFIIEDLYNTAKNSKHDLKKTNTRQGHRDSKCAPTSPSCSGYPSDTTVATAQPHCDRQISEDYPPKEILRALKAKCCEEELDFRAVVIDEVVLTIEQGNLGLCIDGELITACPQVVVFWMFQELAGHGVPLPDTFSYGGHENFAKMTDEAEVLEFPKVVKNTRGHRGKAVFLARDKHPLANLSHLIRHEAPYLFQKYVKESHGRDVRVIVVGCRVVGTMLRCSTDGRMQRNCSLGGVGMMCSLSEQGKQLAMQVSNILGSDVCSIDLLMKDDSSFCVCEANANVGFIALDKACNLDVAGIIADYAASLLPSGRLTRRMSLLSVVSTASETSEPELELPANTSVDDMSASSSSVDSDPETTERGLLTKLAGGLFNGNQLLANEIRLLVE